MKEMRWKLGFLDPTAGRKAVQRIFFAVMEPLAFREEPSSW